MSIICLTVTDSTLIIDTDMKQKIEAFKAERKAAKLHAHQREIMDTSAD